MTRFEDELKYMQDDPEISPLDEYLALLQSHDWSYEYSDDQGVWNAGREERREIMDMRDELDADHNWWNTYAPVDQQMREVL